MVQARAFGIARYDRNRAIRHLFVFVVTLVLALSSSGAHAAVRSGIDPGRQENCTFTLGAHTQVPSLCESKPRSIPNGLVASQEGSRVDSIPGPAQECNLSSSIDLEEVDVSGQHGPRCRGVEDGQVAGAGGTALLSMLRVARAASTGTNNPEAQALLAWRAGLTDGPKNVLANWNLTSEPNFCTWKGVGCDSQQQHVVSIDLAGKRIAGSISSGLSGLPFLTTLDLSFNHLSGGIPVDLVNVSSLQSLNLSSNALNGSIPSFGKNSSSLQALILNRNKLTGTIPGSLGQCEQLAEINLGHNKLSGDIPSELGSLANLRGLLLYQNRLEGGLPSALGSCAALVNMSLGWNRLTGSIPDEYSNLQALQGLYLYGNNLSGDLPAWLSDLPNLSYLQLYANGFEGPIPSLLGNSQQLLSLILSNNSLVGDIPAAMVESSNMFEIDLSVNQLNGSIPEELGYLTQLQRLHLEQNLLTGSIPTSLEKCSQLTEIVMSGNQLSGPILSLGTFLQLQRLSLEDNRLNGAIPASLTKCVNLTVLDLSNNNLTGTIPSGIGQLKNLTSLGLSGNLLEGTVPQLGGLLGLQSLNLSNNMLNGSIPGQIGQLTSLTSLGLSGNSLVGSLPELGGLISLQSLTLEHNLLSGPIPATLGNLVQLQVLTLGSNRFVGTIPPKLSQSTNLTTLTLDNNSLNGTIPTSLGQLRSLRMLHLQANKLTGPIPTSFTSFPQMQDLQLSENELIGQIPLPLLSTLSQLQGNFSLANNRMGGSLPEELGLLTNVQTMNLSGNNFVGEIPDEIGDCAALVRLDLSKNGLTGLIPASIDGLSNLQLLNVSHNALTGSLPAAPDGTLTHLVQLDLTANNFSGEIPESLASLPDLLFLNVSDNNLTGPVPQDGAFRNLSASSFLGNPGLCGPILNVSCGGYSTPARNSHKSSLSTGAWIGIAAGIVGLIAFIVAAGFLWRRRTSQKGTLQRRGSIRPVSELLYPQLRFTVQDLKLATENFMDVNLIGKGSLSNVYRGVLPELVLITVKKLKVNDDVDFPPGFIEELDELAKVRHSHLVSILGYCFDTELSALVVQFIPNGSLEEHLHRRHLDWPTRVKISLGIAKALSYLHHDCGSSIVHCDLKPSNVLLDAEFEAHLEDYGLSRLIYAHKLMAMTDSSMASAIGYFPPEYVFSPTVSVKGDVYSYGILLLELLTGKKPTNEMFKDDLTLAKWCQASFPYKILDVLDLSLVGLKETKYKQVNLFMKVALLCVQETPEDRPTMKAVLEMLKNG